MNDAIEQRVEQFVQEMLDLLQQAREVSCAAALRVVSTMLTGVGQPPEAKPSAERRPPASRGGPASAKAATSPRSGAGSTTPRKASASSKSDHRRRRGARSTASKTVVPASAAPPRPSSVSNEIEGPVTQRTPPTTSEAPVPNVAQASPVVTSSAPAAPVPEREARVLDAVRTLGNATASEVAERTGLPNGSVVVTLRALVARGHVARTKGDRGVEYRVA